MQIWNGLAITTAVTPVVAKIQSLNLGTGVLQATVAEYAQELVGLDAAQVKVAISQLNLSNKEKAAIVTMLNATKTVEKYNIEQLEKLANLERGTLAKQLNKDATDRLTQSELLLMMAEKKIAPIDAAAIMSALQSANAKKKEAAAQRELNLELERQSSKMLLKSPAFWASAAMMVGSAIMSIVSAIRQARKESDESARSGAEKLTENAKALDDYKGKIKSMREELDKGNLSEKDAYDKRAELVEIQDDLIERFGLEAKGIDLVTGSIESQIDAIDRLKQSDYDAWKNRNWDAINRATELFTDFQPTDIDAWNDTKGINVYPVLSGDLQRAIKDLNLDMVPKDFHDALQKAFDEADLKIEVPRFGITGDFVSDTDLSDIRDYIALYEQLSEITERLGKEYFGSAYLDYVGSALQSYSAEIKKFEEAVDNSLPTYEKYVEGQLQFGEEYSDVWKKIQTAQDKFAEAVKQGDEDAVKAAVGQMDAAKQAFLDAGWDDGMINSFVNDFFEKFEAKVEAYNFDAIKTDDSVRSVRKLTDAFSDLGVEIKEIYAHGGNVDLLDRRVVEVTNANLGKVQTHDANAQVGDRMTVLSKTIQQGEKALVVTPILPNGEILSDAELTKYVEKVVKAAKKDKSTNYQAYDQKGVFLSVFGDHATFEKNNEEAEQFAERLHEVHEAILEADSNAQLDNAIAQLEELTEYNPSVAAMAEKFADAESKITMVGKALGEFSKDGSISNDTLAEIGNTVLGDCEAYDRFAKVLMNTSSTAEDAQAAADALATEYINSALSLDMLAAGNSDLVRSMLKKIGVTNADEVVEARLNVVRWEAKLAAEGYADAEWSLTEQKLREIGATNADIAAIEGLRKKQVESKTATINFATANSGTIASLIQMAEAAGIAGKRLEILTQIANLEASATPGMKLTYQYGAAMKRLKDQLLAGFSDDLKVELPEVNVSVPKVNGGSSGGSGSSKKETERYIAEIDRFREAIKKLEDTQEKANRLNGELGRTDGLWDQIEIHRALTDVYEDEQSALHNLNEERRRAVAEGVEKLQKLGFDVDYDAQSNNLYIRNLDHLNELATTDLTKYETMADMSVNIIGKYKNVQEATNGLIKDTEGIIKTITEYNDANKEGSETWWEVRDAIRAARQSIIDNLKAIAKASHDAVDEIQNVYDTLHGAADELAASGGEYIPVDTYQSILNLGEQYMQYLRDENGLLIINEDRIQDVIAAKTRQMAVDQAFTYVKRLEEAIEKDSIEDLSQIIFATTEATDATWGLVYANLAMLDLTDEQYDAALHNINTIRDLAEIAVQSIGKETDAFKRSLEDMKDGLDGILKYIMDMLRDRVNEQIQGVEDMKTAYAEVISQRKEALRLAKEENNYQKTMASRMKELAKLQAKYDALSLDDSRAAQAERASIAEEIAKLQDEINEAQSDRMVDKTEKSLDEMQKAYELEKDNEIDILNDSISSTEKLYRMAMDYLDNEIAGDYKKLRDQLCEWNYEMGNSLQSEIETAVDNAIAALERFGGSYQDAIVGVKAKIESAGDSSGTNLTVGKMGDYGGESQGWREDAGAGIVQQMHDNSVAWHNASADKRIEISADNERLAKRFASVMGGEEPERGKDGVWYWNGRPLYQQFGVYHKGGVVGGGIKENEQLALLENHEWVLTEKMADNLSGFLMRMSKLQSTAKIVPNDIRQQLFSTAPQMVSSVTSNSQPVTIQFGDTTINGASAETAAAHVRVTEDMVNEILRVMKRDLYH